MLAMQLNDPEEAESECCQDEFVCTHASCGAMQAELRTKAEAHTAEMESATQQLREAQGELQSLNEALAAKAREYRSIEGRHRAAQIELKMLQASHLAVFLPAITYLVSATIGAEECWNSYSYSGLKLGNTCR